MESSTTRKHPEICPNQQNKYKIPAGCVLAKPQPLIEVPSNNCDMGNDKIKYTDKPNNQDVVLYKLDQRNYLLEDENAKKKMI